MLLKCKIMMNAAKEDFYTNFVAKNSTDQGRLFRAAKKLQPEKEVPSFLAMRINLFLRMTSEIYLSTK